MRHNAPQGIASQGILAMHATLDYSSPLLMRGLGVNFSLNESCELFALLIEQLEGARLPISGVEVKGNDPNDSLNNLGDAMGNEVVTTADIHGQGEIVELVQYVSWSSRVAIERTAGELVVSV